MDAMRSKAWFAPKRFGYGATPVTWEGWLATAIYVVVFTSALIEMHGVFRYVVAVALTTGFILFARAKTSGPWTWRSGG